MWIKTTLFLWCLVAASAADSKKKEKRNLYNLAYHHSPLPYLERRISTGPQIPLYHSQFPRSFSPYHKGRPSRPPPYAVQMEPLVHYSQRDPLYDTNAFTLNADGHNDLLTDNNHLSEHVYGPPHKIIERPVYIKEPEPIIEIIIKESNVTLPPPPTVPPPPKKKEQVQVFYVKYKKNPHGTGKDSIIYDKPIPAISPPIEDEPEEEPPQVHHEPVTAPPPPSTTLRTIIKPDSETYHSPSGVKVTFGKEGFDYDKRSSKPEDLKAASDDSKAIQVPQGRQLSSFPSRRPPSFTFNAPSTARQPQPYRPFNQFRQQSFGRPNQQEYSTLPKFPQFNQPKTQSFPPPRPVPPQFHRQPVPYQPFDSARTPVPFRPETHFPITQAPPLAQKPAPFNQFPKKEKAPQFQPQNQPPPHQFHQASPNFQFQRPQEATRHQPQPQLQQEVARHPPQFQQEARHQPQFQQSVTRHQPQFPPEVTRNQPQPQFQPDVTRHQPQFPPEVTRNQPQFQPRPDLPQFQQQRPQTPPQYQHQQHPPHQHQSLQFNAQPSIIPPGGELIQSVPKYEQHISVSEPLKSQSQPQTDQQYQQQTHQQQTQSQTHQQQYQIQQSQSQPQTNQYQIQPQIQQSSIRLSSSEEKNKPQNQPQSKIEQQLREANALQESIRHSSPNFYNFQQSQQLNFYQSTSKTPNFYQSTSKSPSFYQTTSKPSNFYQTSTTTTTTTTTQKPSTTTKDPKILNAQLPDEVPDDLRAQLLSSGILNNADISVLDYDKVGDIPLSALPPDQLANFFNAGGGQQIAAGSDPVPSIAERELEAAGSEIQEVTAKPEVQMKVVRYDPESDRGQQVQEKYVQEGAKRVEPVALNDQTYNRYLPLKVSGAQFPIPDFPELKGKKISSVVVLAPVSYDFSSSRETRETKEEIELLEGQILKELLKNPTKENFERFLKNENQTKSEKQAVVLLVTGEEKEKEIFMYDIATKTVSKLDGELSSAFVEAAEANSSDSKTSASSIVETRVPYDLEADGSERLESFVDVSGLPIDLTTSDIKTGS